MFPLKESGSAVRAGANLSLFGFAFLVLFYWFRYKCASILRMKTCRERALQVAAANQLQFAQIADNVNALQDGEFDAADRILVREYDVLICLLRYTSAVQRGGFTFGQRLLMLDFRMLTGSYPFARKHLPSQARRTLDERARILTCLASAMSERTAAVLRA